MTDERLLRLVRKRIQEIRRAKHLTQEDMMKYNFERRYYQRIEAGHKNLSLRVLNRLARALGVDIIEFFRFT